MKATQQFRVTLPAEMAAAIEDKVAAGEYASVSDALREGVQSLLDRDIAVERWLREEVLPGHAEYLADPSSAVPLDQVIGRIKARRAADKS